MSRIITFRTLQIEAPTALPVEAAALHERDKCLFHRPDEDVIFPTSLSIVGSEP